MRVSFRNHIFILFGVLLVLGCSTGRDTIVLRYHPAKIDIFGCTNTVSLVALEDRRKDVAIGNKDDGRPIYAKSDVSEWISRAMYDELKRSGSEVAYHDKKYDFNTDYVITGFIKDTYVRQKSLSSYLASMKIYLEISKNEKNVLKKTFTVTRTKKTLPSPGANSNILTELLQGAMREIIPFLCNHFKTN